MTPKELIKKWIKRFNAADVDGFIGNQNGTTTIVAPLLIGTKTYPFVVNIKPTAQNGLNANRHINLSQMRAVDAQRIKNKQGILEEIYAVIDNI